MNVAKITGEYVAGHPSVKDCLKKGLVNYSALSRLLIRELKLEGKDFDAVLIACRRHAEKLGKGELQEESVRNLLRKSRVEVKNRIMAAVVEKEHSAHLLAELEKAARRKAALLYAIEGTDSVTIVGEEELLEKVKESFGSRIIKLNQRLALVTIKSPKALEKTSGVLAALATSLAERGINIVEGMSCWTDTLFVVEEKDTAAVMDAVRF